MRLVWLTDIHLNFVLPTSLNRLQTSCGANLRMWC